MARRVKVWVHAGGKVFAPGDEVPEEIAPEIRNPACWEDDVLPDGVEPSPDPAGPAPPAVPVQGPDDGGDEPPVAPVIPPKSGKGSGRDQWAAYAESLGVATVDDEGKPLERHQIIDAIDAAGFPTE
jgi:hypothetical protein